MNQPVVAAKEEDDLDAEANAETQETQRKAQPPAVAVVAKKTQPVAVVKVAPKKVQPVAMPKKVHHVATQHVATQKVFPNKGHHVFSTRAAKRKSVSIHGQHLS